MAEPFRYEVTEPVTIRGYTPGGKGGWGHSSTPIHRLALRLAGYDQSACGEHFRGRISVKDGRPKPKDVEKYGVCKKCWPDA